MKVGELRVLLTKLPHSADNCHVIINNENVEAIQMVKGRIRIDVLGGVSFVPLENGRDTVLKFSRSTEHSDGRYYQTRF